MENKLPYKKNKEWYAVEFGFNNPTQLPYTLDLFNGYNQTPIQTYPNPIVPPSGVTSSINGTVALGSTVYNPVNNFLYVSDNNGLDTLVINCLDNSIVTTITGAASPQAYNPVNNSIYCVDGVGGFVYVVNCSTNTISNTINVGSALHQAVYNPVNNKIYVGGQSPNQNITVINCSTNTISSLINISGTSPYLAYNSLSNNIYGSGGTNINIVNCNTDSFSGSFFLTNTDEGIVYNPLNDSIYVSESGLSNKVNVVSCINNSLTATISVGNLPVFLSYNSLSNLVYSTSVVDKTISEIDCYSNTVSSTISVPNDCITSTFVPQLNTLYVTNNGSNILDVLASPIPFVTYISGTTNYNQFVAELNNIPKRARQMRLIVDNSNQLSVPLDILKRDANGNFCNTPKIPTEYRDANNYQGSICDIPFEPKELILNNQMIISQYTIAPNSTVKMVLYFDEIDMSDLLSEKLNVYNQIETKVEDLNTISEDTLEVRYDNRPSIKPNWLKNFKSGKSIKI